MQKNVILPFSLRATVLAVALSGMGVAAVAQKSTLSDAQIDSNVLKSLANEPRLAKESITSSTAFGTVTLTGSVADASERDLAEQLVARTEGVKKVVDQITVGAQGAPANGGDVDPAAQNTLPDNNGGGGAPADGQTVAQGQQQQPMMDPQGGQQQQAYGDPNQNGGQQPGYQNGDPNAQQQQHPGRLYRRDYERQMAAGGYNGQGGPQGAPQGQGQQGYSGQNGYGQQQGGQVGGQRIAVPAGSVVNVRINRWLASGDVQTGTNFDAIVTNDIVAGGAIAIPRGATVQGTVLDAHGAGVLKGRGSLTLQLTNLSLGGQTYPLVSDPWTINGSDKTARTVNSALGLGAVGAIIGAVAGGGAGAAIGAGVGGAAGLGASAASNGGQAVVPGEAPIAFRLAQPTQVVTVSEGEMQRLGGYAGPHRPDGPPRYGAVAPYGYGYPVVGVGVGYPYYWGGGYYGRPYYRYRGYYGRY